MNLLILMCCFFYFVIGMTGVFLGGMIPELLPHYNRAYTDGGILLFIQFMGFLIGVIAMPKISEGLGRKQLLFFALLVISVSYVSLGLLPNWFFVLILIFFTGFGSGIIESTIGALVIQFVEEKKAITMSKLDVSFGIGALLMPATVGLFISMDIWRWAFFAIAGFTMIIAILWVSFSYGEAEGFLKKNFKTLPPTKIEKHPLGFNVRKYLIIFIVFFFVYQGLEISIMNFLPSIMIENIAVNPATASLGVTVFWTSMVIGRVFVGMIAERIGYVKFLIYSSFGALIILIGMAISKNYLFVYILIFLLGLLMSGLFSIALILANEIIQRNTEKVTSLLVASAGIGGSVLSFSTGWSLGNLSASSTLWLFVFFQGLLCILIILTIKSKHK
jgi:MFS transporter, FHS family, glucose/mannose:H+ symporter